jgi:hypothetical protein
MKKNYIISSGALLCMPYLNFYHPFSFHSFMAYCLISLKKNGQVNNNKKSMDFNIYIVCIRDWFYVSKAEVAWFFFIFTKMQNQEIKFYFLNYF